MLDSKPVILSLISEYMDHWRRADISALLSMYSENIRYHDMSTGETIEYGDLEPFLVNTFATEADSILQFRGLVHLEGNTAFIHWTQQLNALDHAKSVDVSGVELIVFDQGKIVSVHEFYDFHEIGREANERNAPTAPSDQLNKLGLGADEVANIAAEIRGYFETQNPYLLSDLNLLYVSERLGYTRNQISYIINHVLGCSFYDYVNKHRVDHVIEHISGADSKASIIELAIDAGFNSISGFYKAFKKQTGLTPTAFRKSIPDSRPQNSAGVRPKNSSRTRTDDA